MTRLALQKARQPIRLLIGVVHPVRHGVLVGDAPAGPVKIPAAGLQQLLHANAPVDGHDPAPGLVVRGVEGNR